MKKMSWSAYTFHSVCLYVNACVHSSIFEFAIKNLKYPNSKRIKKTFPHLNVKNTFLTN